MVCRCMCRSVVDENAERTEQIFVHQVRRRGWGSGWREGGREGREEGQVAGKCTLFHRNTY